MKNILLPLLLLASLCLRSQVVINELDSDTPSTDDKEFIELRSDAPGFSLDGYVLVLYNGSGTSSTGNRSYFALDLDGLSTDVNGLVLIGNAGVSLVPERLFSTSVIQNGADAVALYLGNPSDFPDGTLATTVNLVDALVYDTSDPAATELMDLLGETLQVNENANGLGTTQSIQRKPDGTYEVKAPTPGAHNDGSGIAFNGLSIAVSSGLIDEGGSFTVTFTAQQPVTSDLSFNFLLNNGSFNAADYAAVQQVVIPAGSQSASVAVLVLDDTTDDGDELAIVRFGALPAGYNRLNDFVEVRIIDNDFTTSPWGTPLNPTFGNVQSTAPAGYYASLEGKAGEELRAALQAIIADPAVVREHTYGDAELILKQADQNPLNSNQVWLMYVEVPRAKYKFQSTSSSVGFWNREHIFPQSRGGFADGTSSTADGIDIFAPTDANDILAGHSDAHHIRAEDGPENTTRSNRDYGTDYNGPAGNAGSWKGDVARSLFYMAVRYNGLSLVNGNPPDTLMGQMADLASLLLWNVQDPSDDFEMNRNNVIYTWQMNRNPFIDYPLLADYLFGAQYGQPWSFSLSTAANHIPQLRVAPNPTNGEVAVSGLSGIGMLEIYAMGGSKVFSEPITDGQAVRPGLPSGIYLARITAENASRVLKLVVR